MNLLNDCSGLLLDVSICGLILNLLESLTLGYFEEKLEEKKGSLIILKRLEKGDEDGQAKKILA